ncbi:MAG: tetratricopeptide repeat protein, partial [Desulfuromonadales bacterium]
RKDVLNGFFLLASVIYYLQYLNKKQGGAKDGMHRFYAISLVLFLLSLLAKPSSVVLPFMLLVLDWYPLNRLQKGKIVPVLLEKVPYLLISILITLITIVLTLKYDSFNSFTDFPLDQRVIASGNSIFEYVKLMLYPVGIIPHYDLPKILPFSYIVKGIAALVFVCSCYFWREKVPWLNAIMFLFIIPILPVLQIFANGTVQVILLCRYTYIPSMLPSIIAAVVITLLYKRIVGMWPRIATILAVSLTISIFVFYVLTTQKLIAVWKDSGAMWSRVIAYHPFDKAYFYRGLFYVDSGNYMAAVEDYSICIKIAEENRQTDVFNLNAFRGEALIKAGFYEEAIRDFNVAISMFPHRLYYYHRGLALRGLGKEREAEDDFLKAGRAKGQMYWFSCDSPL